MSRCATVQKLFSSYIEQSIDPESKRYIEQHLEVCTECAKAVSDIKFLSARFKKLQPIQTSDTFDQQLRARIIENRPIAANTSFIKTMSYGLSTAVILIVVYFFINSDPTIPSQNRATTAPVAPIIQSAGINQDNALNQVVDQEQKMAVAANDSSDTKRLSDEEKRALNLVDQ